MYGHRKQLGNSSWPLRWWGPVCLSRLARAETSRSSEVSESAEPLRAELGELRVFRTAALNFHRSSQSDINRRDETCSSSESKRVVKIRR